MVFSSYLFLFIFIPIFFACYFLSPQRLKNFTALCASYFFYAWGAPKVVSILFFLSIVDYVLGNAIEASNNSCRKRGFFICSLFVNLGSLFYFKYANFFIAECNRLLAAFGFDELSWVEIALPIGISFFTFQKISYIVDVYRGDVKPASSFVNYALYVALFPQLIAGPIIRYHDVNEQILTRRHDLNSIFYGIYRFSIGLAKKVLIADTMGSVADNVFKLPPEALTPFYAWLGILCYAYQIYFDFSGYSDMAIGLGRIMGFRFLENFDRPYISRSFTEFWRRWHISLSNWMREYLYIPLGGNRVSPARVYLNLWIVFLLSGLWHGASWNFVVWGAYHGLFLSIDKLFWLKWSQKLKPVVCTLITFVLVLIGWVFFRSETLSQAFIYLGAMFGVTSHEALNQYVPWGLIIHNRAITIFAVATLLTFLPLSAHFNRSGEFFQAKNYLFSTTVLRFAFSLAIFLLSVLALATTNYNPFIYFRF